VYRLAYNGDVAAGQLAVFQGATEVAISDLHQANVKSDEPNLFVFSDPGGSLKCMKSGIFKVAAISSCIALGTSIAFAWGEHTFIRTIQTQTMIIRHKATEEQRRVAQSNAKTFFSQLTPEKKMELKKKNIHAVLIRTTRSKETSATAKDVRMRYNLEGESLIDGYAYEFDTPLQAGTIAQAKGIDPEFVGQ
jgi:hypothetical protein